MKKWILAITGLIVSLGFMSACGDMLLVDNTIIGSTSVPLDVTENVVRGQEAPIGNLIADAFKNYADNLGYSVDFAIQNGGGIRFGTSATNGVYPAGFITNNMVSEILPFINTLIILEVTGAQVKEILERSVAVLPARYGGFLQLSREMSIIVNQNNTPQGISTINNQITTPGTRVTAITINGQALNITTTYKFAANSFIAAGGDDYITLKNLADSKKTNTGLSTKSGFIWYLETFSPVGPIIEGRINL